MFATAYTMPIADLATTSRWHPTQCCIYFTAWTILLIVMSPLVHPYINLPLLSMIVLVFSMYVVHIWPKRMLFVDFANDRVGEIKGNYLVLLNIIFHVLPMTYIIVRYANNKATHGLLATTNAIALLLIYVILMNPHHVYGVPQDMFSGLLLVAVCIYALTRI
jgi:hypothetical protein